MGLLRANDGASGGTGRTRECGSLSEGGERVAEGAYARELLRLRHAEPALADSSARWAFSVNSAQ